MFGRAALFLVLAASLHCPLLLDANTPAANTEVLLWPNGAPGSEGITTPEKIEPPDANGAAMIIAPGGGHRFLSFDIEGTNVARYLNSIEFGVNPARVGIMGFSAGGELTALGSTRYDEGNHSSADPVERQSSRPDYQVLIYPGGDGTNWKAAKGNPPAFLLCAANDKNPATNLATLYPVMLQSGVEHPAHPSMISTTWYLRVGDWMKSRGFLDRSYSDRSNLEKK